MTFRIRQPQQEALANSHVGHVLADRLRPLAKSADYDPHRHFVRVVGHRDQELVIGLDGKGNVLQLVTPLRRVTSYFYDQDKQVAAQMPTGLVLRTQYDALGRPANCARSDGESVAIAYNEHGQLAAIRAGDAPPLRLVRDSEQRITQVVERDGSTIQHRYDEQGRLERVTDPLGRETGIVWNANAQPVAWIEPDGIRSDYAYLGPEIKQSVDGTVHATYTSDSEGRLGGGNYADGYSFSFERDDQGRVTKATTPDAEVAYEYDDAGRVVSEAQNGLAVRYAYDLEGQLVEMTLPDGRTVAYEYDLDGRVSAARDVVGHRQHFNYGAADRPTQRLLDCGLVEDYAVDAAGRLEGVELRSHSAGLWGQHYRRDTLGRIVERTDSRYGGRHFHYDTQDRLLAVTTLDGSERLEAYSYDKASERVASLGFGARFDAMCRPTMSEGHSFTHDKLGNRDSDASPSGRTTYVWTGPNRLSEVRLPSGAVIRYGYDAFGRRVFKQTESEKVTYIWAGHHLVQELHEHEGATRSVEYLYFPSSHRLLSKCEHGQSYSYHCDQLDTPQLLLDASGRQVWSATHAAFGRGDVDTALVIQPWRFPGQYCDEETGLHYNFARYYDASTGLYLSRDPAAAVGENAYLYAGGNPLNVADPLGLFWESAPSWVKTAVTITAGIAVGVAVGALVVAAAPLLGVAAGVAGVAAIIAGGIAGGAAAGGLNAAMTEGGCVLCGMWKGALIGGVAAIPFAFLPATAGYLAFAGVGAASGAIGYFGDLALNGGQFSWTGLGESMALGAALGVAGKFIHGLLKGGGEAPPEGEGSRAPGEGVEGEEAPRRVGGKGAEEPTPPGEEATGRDRLAGRPDEEILNKHYDDLDAHEAKYQKRVDAFDAFDGPARQRGANQAKVTEASGERALADHMVDNEPGTEMVRGFEPGTGYDQVWVRRGPDGNVSEYVIGEGKGPGAELGQTATKGSQMSPEWVEGTAEEMTRSSNPDKQQLGQDILDALRSGDPPVTGRVVQSDGQGGSNLVPVDGTTTPEYN